MAGQGKRPSDSYLLSTADFNHLIEIALIQAREHILKSSLEGYIPVAYLYFIEPKDGSKKNMIALMPDFDIANRYSLLESFGQRIANEGHLCMAFVFVSEAWRSIYQGNTLPKDHPMPRDDPKRTEAIVAMGQTVEGRTAVGYLDFFRDGKNRIKPLEMSYEFYNDDDPHDASSAIGEAFWVGYRNALREKLMNDPIGKEMLERLKREASGSDPEAENLKYN